VIIPRHLLSRLTHRLFWKIFLAFWIAMTLAGIVLLAVETTRSVRLASRWRAVTGDAFAVYAGTVAQDFDAPQGRGATEFLANMELRTRIRAWLFDTHGQEVSGYAAAEWAKLPAWLKIRISILAVKARHSKVTEFDDLNGLTLAAHVATSTRGETLVLAGTLPDARYDFWSAMPQVQFLRFLAILAVAGAVSLILARHLTLPLEALRMASKRLAQGDFSARAGTAFQGREDEIASLATDFDEMAARIEVLLGQQEKQVAAQRSFLADAAHELRSPLARAGVALELARDALGLSSDAEGQSHLTAQSPVAMALRRIEQENGRLAELVDRLLVLSRLESGVIKPDFVLIDLTALVRAVALDANFEAQPQHRKVSFRATGDSSVLGITSLLRSAVENVVRNALRHTPAGSGVDISVAVKKASDCCDWDEEGLANGYFTSPPPAPAPVETWAVISIRDYGPGLPEEHFSQVFRPFFSLHSAPDRPPSGSGLGLTITARAIELHEGQYRIRNADPGLEIEMRLPVPHEEAPKSTYLL
jgi:two-component system sensor histidine kinase CpxA